MEAFADCRAGRNSRNSGTAMFLIMPSVLVTNAPKAAAEIRWTQRLIFEEMKMRTIGTFDFDGISGSKSATAKEELRASLTDEKHAGASD